MHYWRLVIGCCFDLSQRLIAEIVLCVYMTTSTGGSVLPRYELDMVVDDVYLACGTSDLCGVDTARAVQLVDWF